MLQAMHPRAVASTRREHLELDHFNAATLPYKSPRPYERLSAWPVHLPQRRKNASHCRYELPFATTASEAATCLMRWTESNRSRVMQSRTPQSCRAEQYGGRVMRSGQEAPDAYALRVLSDGGTTPAQWARALWSTGERPRTFFEAGAYNGISESNTLIFERCLNWTGVLIEANPNAFHALGHAGRIHSHRVHAAPSCRQPGTATISSGGTEATLAFNKTAAHGGFEVPCVPLQLILSKLGALHFDLFSLDVESYELRVLETLDLSPSHKGFSAALMIIESTNRQCQGACQKVNAVRALLRGAGYTMARVGVGNNDVFSGPRVLQP